MPVACSVNAINMQLTCNNAGNVTITVNSGFTGASLEIDGSQLDANVTTLTQGETLTVSNASDTALTVNKRDLEYRKAFFGQK